LDDSLQTRVTAVLLAAIDDAGFVLASAGAAAIEAQIEHFARATRDRPAVVSLRPYRTRDPASWLCSVSTPPGAGVYGMWGPHATAALSGPLA